MNAETIARRTLQHDRRIEMKPTIGVVLRDKFGVTVRVKFPNKHYIVRFLRNQSAFDSSPGNWDVDYINATYFNFKHGDILRVLNLEPYDGIGYRMLKIARDYLHATDGWKVAEKGIYEHGCEAGWES